MVGRTGPGSQKPSQSCPGPLSIPGYLLPISIISLTSPPRPWKLNPHKSPVPSPRPLTAVSPCWRRLGIPASFPRGCCLLGRKDTHHPRPAPFAPLGCYTGFFSQVFILIFSFTVSPPGGSFIQSSTYLLLTFLFIHFLLHCFR